MNEKNIFLLTLAAAIAFTVVSIFYLISNKNLPLIITNFCIALIWWYSTYSNYKKYKKQKNE
ncbi:MAG: hypothetical protein ACRC6T_12870 [Sarcina sp.]